MATKNGTGAAARPNPASKRTRKGEAPVGDTARQAAAPAASSAKEAPLTIDGERKQLLLAAAWQTDALVEAILGLVEPGTKGNAITGIAARIRDLSDATLSLIDDPHDSLARLHRKVHGAFPEGERDVS